MISISDQDLIRDTVCREIAQTIKAVSELDPDDLNAAVLAAYMAKRESSTEDEIAVVMKWANKMLMHAVALHFFLIGATECSVQNGDVAFRMESPDELMRQLVRHGVAKPTSVPVSVCPG